MAKGRKRKESMMNSIASTLNKSLIPLEYYYTKLKGLAKHVKKAAPLVYGEVESLIKSNIVTVEKKGKFFKKSSLAKFGETITNPPERKEIQQGPYSEQRRDSFKDHKGMQGAWHSDCPCILKCR